MYFPVILTILSCASLGLGQGIWIESPKVTNFGTWGPEEFCANGSDVTGFRLKVQTDQGILDDTALNAIELHCTPQEGSEGERHVIISKEGIKGNWGTILECPVGTYVDGFQMRSEELTAFDNTAANNVQLFCSDGSVLEGVGMDWGDWTGPLHCPRDMKVCGLRTQVEDPVLQPPSMIHNILCKFSIHFS